jgi:hypothetical protein
MVRMCKDMSILKGEKGFVVLVTRSSYLSPQITGSSIMFRIQGHIIVVRWPDCVDVGRRIVCFPQIVYVVLSCLFNCPRHRTRLSVPNP